MAMKMISTLTNDFKRFFLGHYFLSDNRCVRKGDILELQELAYKHYALYMGHGKIIHFGLNRAIAEDKADKEQTIHIASIQELLITDDKNREKDFKIYHPEKAKFSPNKSINRAKSRLGEAGYNLISNNCEHFVNWCVYDKKESFQVDDTIGLIALPIISGVNWWNNRKNKKNSRFN